MSVQPTPTAAPTHPGALRRRRVRGPARRHPRADRRGPRRRAHPGDGAEPLPLGRAGGVRQPQHRHGGRARTTTARPTSCCATPTSRCIAPRARAAAATPSSSGDARRGGRAAAARDRAPSRRRTAGVPAPVPADRRRSPTGEVAGFEALVRWQHPDRGLLAPATFLPVAEEIGLITQIDEWMLAEACRQAQEWQREHGGRRAADGQRQPLGQVAGLAELVGRVRRRPARHAACRRSPLRLEVTESVAVADAGGCRASAGPARPRRARVARRLRHRLLLAELPAAVPGRHAQDRSIVRRAHQGQEARGRRDRPPDRQPRRDPGASRSWPRAPRPPRR